MTKEQQDQLVMFLITSSQAMQVSAEEAVRNIEDAERRLREAKINLQVLNTFRTQVLLVGKKLAGHEEVDPFDVNKAMQCPEFKQEIFATACDAADELSEEVMLSTETEADRLAGQRD